MSGTPALRFNRPSGFHWLRLVVALACAAVLNGPLITESNAAGAKVHDPDRGTLTVEDGVVSFRTGAGIVADSRPEAELAETRAKARGLLRALGVAA